MRPRLGNINNLLSRMKSLQSQMNNLAERRQVLSLEMVGVSEKIGRLLRVHRVTCRLRQGTVAKKLCLTQSKLCQYENGQMTIPILEAERIKSLLEGRDAK